MFWKKSVMDERFVMHRLYSTRFAALATAVFVAGWFVYDAYVYDVVRQDLLLILAVTAVTKIAAMLYYRFTD